MSRLRVVGSGVLIAALVLGAAACSKDEKKATKTDRPPVSFADPPKGSTDLGLCYAYDLQQMKNLIGGEETFKQLPPSAIGAPTDKVKGEACGWERTEPNGDAASLRIEVRNYGEDTAGLATQFAALEKATPDAEPVADLGDDAFSATTDETTLLQVQSGTYLLTLSSRGTGALDPVSVKGLTLLAATGLDELP